MLWASGAKKTIVWLGFSWPRKTFLLYTGSLEGILSLQTFPMHQNNSPADCKKLTDLCSLSADCSQIPFAIMQVHKRIVHSEQNRYSSVSDPSSDLKWNSNTVLNLMSWARTCFTTNVHIWFRLYICLLQLCTTFWKASESLTVSHLMRNYKPLRKLLYILIQTVRVL